MGFEQFQNLINKPKHQSRIKPGTKEKLLRVETGKTGTIEEMKSQVQMKLGRSHKARNHVYDFENRTE